MGKNFHGWRGGAWVLGALALWLVMLVEPGRCGAQTWAGGNAISWNDPNNWSPASVPNSTSAAVTFGDSGLGSGGIGNVIINSSVSAQSLTFNAITGSYAIASAAGQTLSGVTTINISAGETGLNGIALTSVATGNLLFPSGGNLTINNNATGGLFSFGTSTVVGTPGGGGLVFNGAGASTYFGSFAVTGSPNNTVVGGVTKNGPGSLDWAGDGTNLVGTLVLNGGSMTLDYAITPATKVASGSALALNGGVFELNGGGGVTQSFAATSFGGGQTDIIGPIASSAITFAASTISRSPGATTDVEPQMGTFSITTSTGNTNGLLGAGPAFATYNKGDTWATVSGGAIGPLTSYGSTFSTNTNTDVTGSTSVSGGSTTNSIRFNTNTSPVVTLNGTLTLQSGGILVNPSATGTPEITGGSITASNGGELIFHVYAPFFGIFSSLVSNNATTKGLTKTGPGLLLLQGNDSSMTGPININRGDLEVLQNVSAVNSASQINFNDARDSTNQQFVVNLGFGANGSITPAIRVSDFGSGAADDYGTLFTTASSNFTGGSSSSTVTLSGVISSAANQTTPIRFAGPTDDTSAFNLTNAGNTFTGTISLTQGSLGITANGSLGNSANTLYLESTDAIKGGLVFLNSGINLSHPIIFTNFGTRIVSNGTDSNTISGSITGLPSTTLYKDGTGTLTLSGGITGIGELQVNLGTLALSGAGENVPSGTSVVVVGGATFNAGLSPSTHYGTMLLAGGTFTVSALNPGFFFVNTIVTGGANSVISFPGSGTYTLALDGSGADISIAGNSTWLSPANHFSIGNVTGSSAPFIIQSGSILTNGIALSGVNSFTLSGGGTLFQNSDATNVLTMSAPLTVESATTFRVADASSNGGVGNFGTGAFTLDGGTFEYSGGTAVTSKPIALTVNNGTFQIDSGSTLTDSAVISGPGALTKTGGGTLILTNTGNTFPNLTITTGTIQTANDNTLGPSNAAITINPAGNLTYTANATTFRTFNLNGGTLAAASGATVFLGGSVNGGFLRGPGTFALNSSASLNGVTTFNSTSLTQGSQSPQNDTNFTNGGSFDVFDVNINGGTNTASGTITDEFFLQVTDFTSSGVINVTNGGVLSATNTLYLGGGSRTYNNAGGDIITSSGATIEVNGALLVNNGSISPTVDVNYGGEAQGTGTYGTVNITYGGLFQPGFAGGSPNNVATVTGLTGNGTIDNATAGGGMVLIVAGSSTPTTFSGTIQNTTGFIALSIQSPTNLTLSTSRLPNGNQSVNTFIGGIGIFSGASLTIAGAGALPVGETISNSGSLFVNANSTAGRIAGSGLLSIGTVSVAATLTLAAGNSASTVQSLLIASNSTLDLTDNDLLLHSGTVGQITNLISQGYNINGTHWTGTGITSSVAALPANIGQGVGALTGAQFLALHGAGSSFDFQPVLATDILLKYTYQGDATLDGKITAADYAQIDAAFLLGAASPTWFNGDFNYDGVVDYKDYALIDFAFQHQVGGTLAAGMIAAHAAEFGEAYVDAFNALGAAAPEPGSLGLLMFGGLAVVGHRRRRGERH